MGILGLASSGIHLNEPSLCSSSLCGLARWRKFLQNWRGRNLKTFFWANWYSMLKAATTHRRRIGQMELPTLCRVVVSSKMYHVCSQMTWLEKLTKAKSQFFQFAKLLKIMGQIKHEENVWNLNMGIGLMLCSETRKCGNVSKNFDEPVYEIGRLEERWRKCGD